MILKTDYLKTGDVSKDTYYVPFTRNPEDIKKGPHDVRRFIKGTNKKDGKRKIMRL